MRKKTPPTILLVDDDPLIRGLGQELLEHLGYRVETAGDGSEALKKFQGMERVDLVVLDYFLPGQNGCEVLKEFKLSGQAGPGAGGVRFFIIPGYGQSQKGGGLGHD